MARKTKRVKSFFGNVYELNVSKIEKQCNVEQVEELLISGNYGMELLEELGNPLGIEKEDFRIGECLSFGAWEEEIISEFEKLGLIKELTDYRIPELILQEDAYYSDDSEMYTASGTCNGKSVKVFWKVDEEEFVNQCHWSGTVEDESRLCNWDNPDLVLDENGREVEGPFEVVR